MSVLSSTLQQRDSDSTGRRRGHWALTVINKYLLQPSVRWGPVDNVCRHISVYKALGSKETLELEEACSVCQFLMKLLKDFAFKTVIHIDLNHWAVWSQY